MKYSINEEKNLNLNYDNRVLYSGEIDQPFRIKIVGIDNLIRLLQSDENIIEDTKRATYNGHVPPAYITKMSE